jgi:hypothetical protein
MMPQQKPQSWIGQAQRSAKVGWKPATFQGLKVGEANRDDVIRRFGEPSSEGVEGTNLRVMSYGDVITPDWPDGGSVSVAINARTGKVSQVTFNPTAMRIPDLVKMLGSEYVTTRWSWVPCDDKDPEYTQIYLDPNGSQTFIEYRSLGILVVFNENRVESLEYTVGKPTGYEKDPCGNKKPRKSLSPGGPTPP